MHPADTVPVTRPEDVRLIPGESIRTPWMTVLFWTGGVSRALNLWRRFGVARTQGQPVLDPGASLQRLFGLLPVCWNAALDVCDAGQPQSLSKMRKNSRCPTSDASWKS